MRKLYRSLLAAGAVLGLAACGDDVSITQPPPPDLVISGAPVTAVHVGDKIQLSANQAVSWSSSNATVASVDANGLVSAAAAGTASITATSTADATKKASVTITVAALTVRSVTVSPNAVTMNPGGTQGFVANVDADPGVARTVTWSSSNTAFVTVTSAGVATAVAPGVATITATSTANTSVSGAASVTVRTPTSARVSIQKVTVAGNLNSPVNLAATAGQIDVTIDVDPGDFVAQKVDLLVDNVVVGSQTFTAQQSADLTNAHAMADLANAVASTVISFNTAAFNATTGAVAAINMNGPHTLSAKLTVVGGGAGGSATPSLAITFVNPNTFVSTLAFTGTTASATGTSGTAIGLAYKRGGLTVTVLPVLYNPGQTFATGSTVSFGSVCDNNGTGVRAKSLTAPAAGSSGWTAAFGTTTSSSIPIGTTVSNYEFNTALPFGASTCGAAFPNGETPVVTAVDNNGNSITLVPNPANPAIRLDNRAPGVPQFAANPNGRQNGWINAAVGLTGSNTSNTDDDWIVNGTADGGIGGGSTGSAAYLRFLRIGDASVDGTVATARSAAASSSPALPAPTIANNTLCAIVTAQDELGNESALPSSTTNCQNPPVASYAGVGTGTTHLRFGVDIDPPTIALCPTTGGCVAAGLASNAQLNGGTVGNEFVVTVADVGLVGNSGMLSGSAVNGTVQIRSATLTPPSSASCFIGSWSSTSSTCRNVSINAAPPFPLVPTTTVAASGTTGYYTYSAFSQDAAGNQSASVSRVIAYDAAANVPALTQALFNVPLNGGTVVFNANASDNFDLQSATYTLTYGGSGLPGPIGYPPVTLNTFNQAPLVNSNVAAGITINGFIRQIELVTGNGPLTTGGGFKPSALTGTVLDMANNSSGAVVTAIAGASVTNGVLYTSAAAAQCPGAAAATVGCRTDSWAFTAPAVNPTNVSDGAATTPTNPLNVVLTAKACGPTATFIMPFSRVDFYAVSGGNLVQIGTGSLSAATDDGSAQGRCFSWSFTWTPGTAFGLGAQSLWALGVNAAGDGLASLPTPNVVITNP